MFKPHFQITPGITKDLMAIEGIRQAVLELPFDGAMLRSLRETAKLLTTHYSTQIEGNRLTQAQVAEALSGARFPGRERDEAEVRNYYAALEEVERLAGEVGEITESSVMQIHGIAFGGKPVLTPYRDGQNVIRDGHSGEMVYMPPEAADVQWLMEELFTWINKNMASGELPAPIIAGIAHYQYATIHPYYDGNGRTARLLTTLILHKSGYGLKGIYSLEEHYSRDLQGYYNAIAVGDSHNYYMGRAEADITGFLAYFCSGMSAAFTAVRMQAEQAAGRGSDDQAVKLRMLDPKQRQVLALLEAQGTASAAEVADHLGLSRRTASKLCIRWVMEGFLEMHDQSKKNRSYRLKK